MRLFTSPALYCELSAHLYIHVIVHNTKCYTQSLISSHPSPFDEYQYRVKSFLPMSYIECGISGRASNFNKYATYIKKVLI